MSEATIETADQLKRLKIRRAEQAQRAVARQRRRMLKQSQVAAEDRQKLDISRREAQEAEAELYRALPGQPLADGRFHGIALRLEAIQQTVIRAADQLRESIDALSEASEALERAQIEEQAARRAAEAIAQFYDTSVKPERRRLSRRRANAADDALAEQYQSWSSP
ncbi:hypothetical protein [Thalassococcus sp. S3]|uniref:hypothetical protein n=1 Tax=Thalassococcus sp. S3 TaxID=2017482 RepID=UPI00102B4F19|nr:hypothetical protein [Thalassococcus sp. S3]